MPEAEDYAKSVEDIVSADGDIGIKRVELPMDTILTVSDNLKMGAVTFAP